MTDSYYSSDDLANDLGDSGGEQAIDPAELEEFRAFKKAQAAKQAQATGRVLVDINTGERKAFTADEYEALRNQSDGIDPSRVLTPDEAMKLLREATTEADILDIVDRAGGATSWNREADRW